MNDSAARKLPEEGLAGRESAPHRRPLFRLVRFLAQPRLGALLHSRNRSRALVWSIVFLEGFAALAVIAVAAYLTRLPLLFPPLGPSAFILLRTPMAPAASPRSVILSHALALAAGLASVHFVGLLFPEAQLLGADAMNWPRVMSLLLAMGVASAAMIVVRCSHPPAAATALIAGMGLLRTPAQIAGLLAAAVILVAQAFVLHRLLSGLPYPLWRSDPMLIRSFGALAGLPDERSSFWDQLTQAVLVRPRRGGAPW